MPSPRQMERDDRPRIERKSPDMLGEITVPTARWVAAICLCAVPREEVLIGIYRAAEVAPVVPVLHQRIEDI